MRWAFWKRKPESGAAAPVPSRRGGPRRRSRDPYELPPNSIWADTGSLAIAEEDRNTYDPYATGTFELAGLGDTRRTRVLRELQARDLEAQDAEPAPRQGGDPYQTGQFDSPWGKKPR